MKAIRFYSCIIFLVMIPVYSAMAQSYTGLLIDATTRRPVYGCLVILKGQSHYTNTDAQGRFQMNLPVGTKDQVLVFTMLGYSTAEYKLSQHPSDTFFISQKSFQLEDVVISAEKKSILNPKSQEIILDFDLLNGNLLLLTSGSNKNNLRLMDESGKLMTRMKTHRHTTGLRRDCIGNVHIYSQDSIWQVFYDYVKLNVLPPYSRQAFDQVIGHCVCNKRDEYYFQYMSYRKLRTHYVYFTEREKGVSHELVNFADTEKIRSFELDYNLQYFLDTRRASHYTMYNEPIDVIKQNLEKYREALPLDDSYRAWLGSVESQLIKVDTNLYMVNYTDTLLYTISPAHEVIYNRPLLAMREKDLSHNIYVDEAYKETYMVRFTGSTLTFIKIDMVSGKEVSRTDIQNTPFLPDKIIIHAGSAYFIQKNLADDQNYKMMKCNL
ncbi:MAG: carboxypeptidase-like regulatory domain-containing protein [Bacteroidetes bacterium]|nr:carboxypeptidase-like regulatory domain-containing protein [Bacteroidota bacterium]